MQASPFYPVVYHRACAHLVAHGGHGGDTVKGRRLCAQALRAYIQGDPRGAALYILRPGDVPQGEKPDSCYSRGLVVY
mgnify:CR=1 FL=1